MADTATPARSATARCVRASGPSSPTSSIAARRIASRRAAPRGASRVWYICATRWYKHTKGPGGYDHGDRRAADQLHGPLRPLGARQLARDRDRLHRGPPPVVGGDDRVRAQGGAVELRALLLGRGRRHGRPVALHRRRPARGAEVLPRHAAGRRSSPRGVLRALHARGVRRRRRHGRGWPRRRSSPS